MNFVLQTSAVALSVLASVLGVAAGEVETIKEIGAHFPIFTVAKNVNPQNLMVVYTRADGRGHFLKNSADGNRPVFDFYWLMDGKTYKPVHSRIKKEIAKRLESQMSPTGGEDHFCVSVNDLKEVNSDIREPKMDVYARRAGDTAKVEAQISLGPSDGNMRIRLTGIYTEGRAFPPAIHSVTLQGEEILGGKLTGKKVTRRYDAERGAK